MSKIGIVACSDARQSSCRSEDEKLVRFLRSLGLEPVMSTCLYEQPGSVFSGTPREKAGQLMRMFTDPEIREIYDISGGDLANQILDELDYGAIAASGATFWGYSDLTTVINAIYTMTGKAGVLYQVRFLATGDAQNLQRQRFQNRQELFSPTFTFAQGSALHGILVGGNIRCFLKLAGTRYFPSLEGRILLLEAFGGKVPQMATYLAQLKQLGAFEKVSGIILGTFTVMEQNHCVPDILTLVREYAHPNTPIAVTREIGHGDDAKAVVIGKELEIREGQGCICQWKDVAGLDL